VGCDGIRRGLQNQTVPPGDLLGLGPPSVRDEEGGGLRQPAGISGTSTSAGSEPRTNIQRQPRCGMTTMASAAVVTAPTW
jgi:hypothetical protein